MTYSPKVEQQSLLGLRHLPHAYCGGFLLLVSECEVNISENSTFGFINLILLHISFKGLA